MAEPISTGLTGLDNALCHLKEGDNIVWQVDSTADYQPFVTPFVNYYLERGMHVVYFRFAKHRQLFDEGMGVEIHHVSPEEGFEKFVKEFHDVINKYGDSSVYVFDCLSELVVDWNSDRMLGNFFMLVCPYIFEAKAIGYFAVRRNSHSFHALTPIMKTLQVFLDVYRHRGELYVHPIKVVDRYSSTMNLIHKWQDDDFLPVRDSITTTEILGEIPWSRLDAASYRLGFWSSTFAKATELQEKADAGSDVAYQIHEMTEQLLRMVIAKDARVLRLARKFLHLPDLLSIRRRMIGTGRIGGKSVGMLLARAIIEKSNQKIAELFEPHDSFFIGADVFYTFLVQNDIWQLRQHQQDSEDFAGQADTAREKILAGEFPEYIVKQFIDLLDYFGQSPIIVRSSSLLEDNFGNAFAGKYESIFCANQGTREQRLEEFLLAVKRVYASTMSEDALAYRLQRGLDQQDEQMALLIQRVSGAYKGDYFFPDMAGVGVSYNTFVWKPELDPKAGMLRLVFGLGTRAVDRVEDDYPQTIALDQPLLRPYADKKGASRFSQHNADILDTRQNCLRTAGVGDLLRDYPPKRQELMATRDLRAEQKMQDLGLKTQQRWLLTFEKFLSETDFIPIMRQIMKTLELFYEYPVDIEFTINFAADDSFKIDLVQCRPLQTKGSTVRVEIPENIPAEQVLFASAGCNMGGSISQPIHRIIYVDPQAYVEAPVSKKYSVARLVGKLNRQIQDKETTPTILMGPGRWGTTTPSLGVPVSFSEINKVSVMVEMAYEGGNLMPELSFGTHFFQDLVESDIFYVALFPQKDGVVFNRGKLLSLPNQLTEFLPEAHQFEEIVKVYEISSNQLRIMCDILSQKVVCFFK